MAANLDIVDDKTNTVHMLEPNWTDLQQGFHYPSTIVMTSLLGLQPHKGQLREVQAHCKSVAPRSVITIVSMFFVAKWKSSEILIVNIWECVNQIMEEEEEATPYSLPDLNTWWQLVTKEFIDHFEPPLAVCASSKDNVGIHRDSTVKPHY
jgi:hypothetical protein